MARQPTNFSEKNLGHRKNINYVWIWPGSIPMFPCLTEVYCCRNIEQLLNGYIADQNIESLPQNTQLYVVWTSVQNINLYVVYSWGSEFQGFG